MDQSRAAWDGVPLAWDALSVRTASARGTASTTCLMESDFDCHSLNPSGNGPYRQPATHGRISRGGPRAREEA